jgi:SAM-dependent methyltransferase
MRRRWRPQCIEGASSDTYLSAHTKEYFVEQWLYAYHRVFDLISHFYPTADPASLKVLSIGSRTEIELYYLWLFLGFSWRNITGVDLVSYGPKIQIADMSARLPFSDDVFDVIVASHCLEKSNNPERTRDEIFRVAKPGAKVLVAGDRQPDDGRLFRTEPIPIRLFRGGAYGFMDLYRISMEQIEYLKVYSPHGFEIIFGVNK